MPKLLLVLATVAALLVGCSADASGSRTPVGGSASASAAPGTSGSAGVGTFENPPMNAGSGGSAGTGAPVGSGGTAGADGECGAVTQMAQNMVQPVDIIFAVDTTGSMGEEIFFTEENMNAFSQQITDAGIDVRVFMVSTLKDGMPLIPVHLDGVCIAAPLGSGSCPNDSNPPNYVHVVQPNTDGDILQNFITTYPMYREHLRESSFKTFVAISDGDIQANPVFQQPIYDAATFIAAVEALEPNSLMWQSWRYSAIYSFSACGVGNSEGVTHADLVSRTQGVSGDLCLQDFKPVFDDLAKQLQEVVTLACDWTIPPPPMGETFDAMKTNVELTLDGTTVKLGKAATAEECAARDGWHYDDDGAPQRVVACPATCSRIQAALSAKVDLLFGCQTVVLAPPD